VAKLAGALRKLGIRPGDRVAILADNSDRYLEFFFGVAHSGAVFVPINSRLALPEMVHWLADSGSTALFFSAGFKEHAVKLSKEIPLKHLVYADEGDSQGANQYEALLAAASEVPDALRGYDDLAGIFYTGGTTGRSKGVMLCHRNLVVNALNVSVVVGFDSATNWLHAAPMFHIADGTATFAVAMAGGCHSFVPRFDPVAALRAIEDGATHTLLVPTMINMLINHPDFGRYRTERLRAILYGASPMPKALMERALGLLPQAKFYQAYGQTEAGPVLTMLPPEQHQPQGPTAERLRSAGRCLSAVEVRILDPKGEDVPRRTVGEICARGANVMLGYWNQPGLTAEALRGGWLHTGDGGFMDEDGYVYVVDRVKDMIISGGENIYSAEVENVVYLLPEVAECAVIGVPHEVWGEQVHAVVRLKAGCDLDEAKLIEHCRKHLAGFKIPRGVEFRSEPLPVSGAGKIMKSELRRPWWEGRNRRVN
jgi:long-chain acyl-CoA synthetase